MIHRRTFLALIAAARVQAADFPSRPAKVVKLFRSPDGHPNGLETAEEGFWIGEQVTDRAHLVDWNGKLLHSIETESSNTSGIAFGDGGVWMDADGPAVGHPPAPAHAKKRAAVHARPPTVQ